MATGPTDEITILIQALIWGNQVWGTYILYRFGILGCDALFKQLTANKVSTSSNSKIKTTKKFHKIETGKTFLFTCYVALF